MCSLIRFSEKFDLEVEKLEHWSEDRKSSLEIKLNELDKQIREIKKAFNISHALEEKIELRRKQKAKKNERMIMRNKLYEVQDAIDMKRDKLIENAEKTLHKPAKSEIIFTIEWRIV